MRAQSGLAPTPANLVETGRYRAAAVALDALPSLTLDQQVARQLVELNVGSPRAAHHAAERLLAKHLSAAEKIACLLVLGKAATMLGHVDEGCTTLREAVRLAQRLGDPTILARAQAVLTFVLLGWVGIEAALPELYVLRRRAYAAGDAKVMIEFHSSMAEAEMRRLRSESALKHLRLAESLFSRVDNVALECRVHRLKANAAILSSSPRQAMKSIRLAVDLAERSGSNLALNASLSTLGHVALITEAYDVAENALKRMLALNVSEGAQFAAKDSLMQVALAKGDVASAIRLGDELRGLACPPGEEYHWFCHMSTRARWLISQSHSDEALRLLDEQWSAAVAIHDRDLMTQLGLVRAEALAVMGNQVAAADQLAITVCGMPALTLTALREMNRIASRITSQSTLFEARANRVQNIAFAERQTAKALVRFEHSVMPVDILHSVAALFTAPFHSELVAYEVAGLVLQCGCATCACVVEKHSQRKPRVVNVLGELRGEDHDLTSASGTVTVNIGRHEQLEYSVVVFPKHDAAARLSLLAIKRLVIASTALDTANRLEAEEIPTQTAGASEQQFGMLVATEAMTELLNVTRRVATSNVTVLFTGETGTGKELLARALHDASPRRDKPFIPFNCSAVSRDMLDSQLFGYRRGAFTGAHDAFPGVIRAANGGTLFLDEIGEISPEVQPKLLRFLECGEIHPLGEARPIPVDVRIVAATNANLEQLVADGKFREDLFYRLNVVRLSVPPLRERREEIPLLVQHYIDKFSRDSQKSGIRLADETMEYLVLYNWPGNVRQLANEIRRLVALTESGAVLMPEHLSPEIAATRRTVPASERDLAPTEFVVRIDQPLSTAIEHVERSMIQYALKMADGRVEDASQLLGLSRKGLYLKRMRLKMVDAGLKEDDDLRADLAATGDREV